MFLAFASPGFWGAVCTWGYMGEELAQTLAGASALRRGWLHSDFTFIKDNGASLLLQSVSKSGDQQCCVIICTMWWFCPRVTPPVSISGNPAKPTKHGFPSHKARLDGPGTLSHRCPHPSGWEMDRWQGQRFLGGYLALLPPSGSAPQTQIFSSSYTEKWSKFHRHVHNYKSVSSWFRRWVTRGSWPALIEASWGHDVWTFISADMTYY